MKKIIIIILVAIVLVLLGKRFFDANQNNNPNQNVTTTPTGIVTSTPPEIPAPTTTSQTGLIIQEPAGAKPTVSYPLVIKGYVNGNGWTGFEGQVGTVKLYDNYGKLLETEVLTATTEWTKLPTYFEATLNFDFKTTPAEAGKLVFHNENPSGDSARDKYFTLPVKFR